MEEYRPMPRDGFRIVPGDIRGSVETLKEGRMFVNFLPGGEIPGDDTGGLGCFFADTRFLSCLEQTLNGTRPVLLSRTLRDSHFAQVELTNREFVSGGQVVPLQTVHLRLQRLVKDGFYQRVRLVNFNPFAVQVELRFRLGADFADIFEVRGTQRQSRGTRQETVIRRQEAVFRYLGRDGIDRATRIFFNPAPAEILEEGSFVCASYSLRLAPRKKYYVYLKVVPVIDRECGETLTAQGDLGFAGAAQFLIDAYQGWKDDCIQVFSDNEHFDFMLRTAVTDLRSLLTDYPGAGRILDAGIPWFAAPFGRDALIAAWQILLVNPSVARETLRFMSCFQGRELNDWRDEQPGKIMHELRFGEMARTGETPHTPYYGSVDATLWFVILLGEYIRWTGDWDFFSEMRGPLTAALEWCERCGDLDQDGYIEYWCRSEMGLVNQGWKDSWDGIVDRKGSVPAGPIALVEVQGYYYKALREAAALFAAAGERAAADDLIRRAERLKGSFLRDFWLERRGFLACALDGRKRVVDTVMSNPGHCLFTGILPEGYARRVVARLMQTDLFSGWGIRTMSIKEAAYNPMSYHNGTVWPHDNSIIGFGMRQAGEPGQLRRLVEALFEAVEFFDHARLPELFCGFTRRGRDGPVRYPIACEPQAWAAGSVFLLLRAMLGIECRGAEVCVRNPHLPRFLQTLRLENIRAGGGRAALEFTRRKDKTYCSVVGTEGEVKVVFG